jgi:hypothetical protein
MQSRGNAGCEVSSVTRGSSAQDAGLRELDLIVAIDGVATPRCDVLQAEIVAKSPGHVVRLDVKRSERVVITATLSTRADVLHRRLVGQPMESIDVADADDETRRFDLADTRGKTTIMGWFNIEGCSGCAAVFDRISDAIAKRLKDRDSAPAVLAVTSRPRLPYVQLLSSSRVVPAVTAAAPSPTPLRRHYAFSSNLPMAITAKETFEELAIDDRDRIHFIVIDSRGIVRFVAPVSPGSDDADAAIDEVLAAAEQTENSRSRRDASARQGASSARRPATSLRSDR